MCIQLFHSHRHQLASAAALILPLEAHQNPIACNVLPNHYFACRTIYAGVVINEPRMTPYQGI